MSELNNENKNIILGKTYEEYAEKHHRYVDLLKSYSEEEIEELSKTNNPLAKGKWYHIYGHYYECPSKIKSLFLSFCSFKKPIKALIIGGASLVVAAAIVTPILITTLNSSFDGKISNEEEFKNIIDSVYEPNESRNYNVVVKDLVDESSEPTSIKVNGNCAEIKDESGTSYEIYKDGVYHFIENSIDTVSSISELKVELLDVAFVYEDFSSLNYDSEKKTYYANFSEEIELEESTIKYETRVDFKLCLVNNIKRLESYTYTCEYSSPSAYTVSTSYVFSDYNNIGEIQIPSVSNCHNINQSVVGSDNKSFKTNTFKINPDNYIFNCIMDTSSTPYVQDGDYTYIYLKNIDTSSYESFYFLSDLTYTYAFLSIYKNGEMLEFNKDYFSDSSSEVYSTNYIKLNNTSFKKGDCLTIQFKCKISTSEETDNIECYFTNSLLS